MEPEPTEWRLARLARDGDREALAELVERVRLRLFAWAYADLRHYEDAQDVVASALLQICRRVGTLREPGRALAWMRQIVRNEARHLRRPGAPDGTAVEEAPQREAAPDLLRLDVQRALRRLPGEQARAVSLYYLAGLPVREIARRVDRPEGTVKRWLHLGRRRLAVELEDYATMTQEKTAVIFSSDPAWAGGLEAPVRAAGFRRVVVMDAIPPLERSGTDRDVEFHLPEPLRSAQILILDEWIGGRSAFELNAVLRAAAESGEKRFCLFSSTPERTSFAAWAAGFDLFLDRDPVDPDHFRQFLIRLAAMER